MQGKFTKAEDRRLLQTWREADVDKSGSLNIDELVRILRLMGRELTRAEVRTMVHRFGKTKASELNFDEFAQWWRQELSTGSGVTTQSYHFEGACVRAQLAPGSQVRLRVLPGPPPRQAAQARAWGASCSGVWSRGAPCGTQNRKQASGVWTIHS